MFPYLLGERPESPRVNRGTTTFYLERIWRIMGRPSRYAPEVRERAVRMVYAHQGEHKSQWAAICSIAKLLTQNTLR